jgi:hypothetical protein
MQQKRLLQEWMRRPALLLFLLSPCSGEIGNAAIAERKFVQLLRTQNVLITVRATEALVHTQEHFSSPSPPCSTRAQRAHWRLSWDERLARNARPPTAPSLEITLYGLPTPFARSFGLPIRQVA